MQNKITKETTLEKIIEKKNGAKILMENGVPCLSCPMSQFEIDKLKIGEVCKMYGLKLKKILKELNTPILQTSKALRKSKIIKK